MYSVTHLHQLLDKPIWDLKKIEQFLTQNSLCVGARDRFNRTSLTRVLEDKKCSADMVKLLLRFGAEVNGSDVDVSHPLLVAIRNYKDESIIRLLVEAGAFVDNCGIYKTSALCEALYGGASIEVIRVLLEVVDVTQHMCRDHGSVMHCSMHVPPSESKKDIVKLLIEAGANVNELNYGNESPMCVALQRCPVASDIEDLLSAGFSLSACERHESPLFCATDCNSNNTLKADVVELLLKKGVSLDQVDENGYTPIQSALDNVEADTAAIQLLFNPQNEGPNDIGGAWGNSLLTIAIQNPFLKLSVVKFLVKQGAQVKNVKEMGNTALHLAARHFHPGLIKFLLKHCSLDVNSLNENFQTPLRIAVEYKSDVNVLQALLAAGARVRDDKSGFIQSFSGSKQLLQFVLNCKYGNYWRLDYFEMLAKHSLLQNRDFDIQSLIRDDIDYETLSRFVEGCKRELQKMDLKCVGQGRSLYNFLSEHFLPQMDDGQFDPVNSGDFNHLLEVVEENGFPIYFDVILSKVRRSSMEAKLEEIRVYTVKHCPHSSCIQEKVSLNYESVCVIAAYLSDDELLRFVFAFYNAGDNAHLRHRENVGKQNLDGKRSPEQSDKFPKRPKLFH